MNDSGEWTRWALGFVLTWLATVGSWLVLKVMGMLSRKEHTEICDKKHEEIKALMGEIKKTVGDDRRETMKHREHVNISLERIRTQIAVMRSQNGDDPFSDTGNFRGGGR